MESNRRLIALGLGFSLALFCLVVAWPRVSRADPGTLYVSATDPTCGGNVPCFTNVQDAVDAAQPLDTLLVATGAYTDPATASRRCVAAITKTVALQGGYDASFAEPPDPAANPTTLDAQRLGRVISITGDISPTIEGFVITGGDATGLGGREWGNDAGGGIYCSGAHPIILGNVISNNVASSSGTAEGGGVYFGYCEGALLAGNTIISNTGSTGGSGYGGGVRLLQSDDASVNDNTISSNTASTAGLGYGGGIHSFGSDVTIVGNTVAGNVASTAGSGFGGGIQIRYGAAFMRGNTVRDNVARSPAIGFGGGLRANVCENLTLVGNYVTGNAAQTYGVDATGITLSQPQADLANARIASAGLADHCRVVVRDYREVDEPQAYNALVSVGMFEHVGEALLPTYFARAWQLLRPGGVFLNHGIAKHANDPPTRGKTFSNTYVFPDGELVPISTTLREAENAGFKVCDVESLREHYALTLRHWVRRLEAHHDEALQYVDEPTYRVWRLFMSGSAHGFARGRLNVYQTLLVKPHPDGQSGLPLTRADWYLGG